MSARDLERGHSQRGPMGLGIAIKLVIAILLFMCAFAMAGQVATSPGVGVISTALGTGVISTSSGTVTVVSGTTGQCIGILCGVTYAN